MTKSSGRGKSFRSKGRVRPKPLPTVGEGPGGLDNDDMSICSMGDGGGVESLVSGATA
jgi:hypothetical protein